jgi:hypothetical protein
MTKILTRIGYTEYLERHAKRVDGRHVFPEQMEVLCLGSMLSAKVVTNE